MKEIVGLVPAAGGGTRLYPFSRAVPKEIYPILGKAAIEHCIENLKEGGIKKVFVVVGYQKGALMDYIGDGRLMGVNAAYIYQYERKGLGHAILQGKDWINRPFVVLLGDSYIEPKKEIKKLIDVHREKNPIASVMLFEVDNPEGYGIVKLDQDGKVVNMVEKPSIEEAEHLKTDGKYLAITGLYIFEPKIFDYIEKTGAGVKGEIHIVDSMKIAMNSGEKIFAKVLEGEYLDIGKWKTVLKVEKEFAEKMDIEERVRERESVMRKTNNK